MNEEFAKLAEVIAKIDGVGAKSALRIAYDLAFVNKPLAAQLQSALARAASSLSECEICGCMASGAICADCASSDKEPIIALISSAKDAIFIKRAGGFFGRFFVLAAANEFYLARLGEMISRFGARELLLAHSPGVGSDALCFYLENRFSGVEISKIAQGIPQGIRLADIDAATLSAALEFRSRV